jgi:hypothetical protein
LNIPQYQQLKFYLPVEVRVRERVFRKKFQNMSADDKKQMMETMMEKFFKTAKKSNPNACLPDT